MTAKKKKRLIIFGAVTVFLSGLVFWTAWSNTAIQLNTYTISSGKLPEAFDGYRIAHISDLHNAEIGNGNENLLALLRESEPDIIAVTGDLIDSRNTDVETAISFMKEAVELAPCCYVTGNHEAGTPEYNELKSVLAKLGVNVLANERISLEKDGEEIALIGVDDPSFTSDALFKEDESVIGSHLQNLREETDQFTILLSHRPELFDVYVENNLNLVLSGHAHGGQFRLPFVGGIIAPDQGLFPKYDAGMYCENNTAMIVSRGIGNSIIPFRVNNRPEVILIELKRAA